MACSQLCRHSGADLVGATCDLSSGSVLLTVQGDGVTAYNLEQKQLWSLPLGSQATLEFQVPSAHCAAERQAGRPQGSIVASVVHDRSTKSYTLCLQDTASRARAVSGATPGVPLPGPAHSCHLLNRPHQPHLAAASTSDIQRTLPVAVVLADGRVGVTDFTSEPSSCASASQLTVLASDRASAPRHILAASARDTLVIVTQQTAGTPVALRVLRLGAPSASGAPALAPVKALTVPCPGASAHAVLTGLTITTAFALLQWSHGYATAIHGLQGGIASPLRPTHFPLADAVGANAASSSAPAAANATPASGRKRKNAAAADTPAGRGAGARPRVLCAAVDDGQFLVLDLESSAAQSQICYSFHDAQFGCPLSSGSLDVDAPLLSLDAGQCAVVAAGPEATVVKLGSSLHVMQLRAQPVSLLSLVARLSVSAAAAGGPTGPSVAAASALANGKPPQERPAAGGRAVAAALASTPAPLTLDPGLLLPVADPGMAAAAGSTEGLPDMELHPVPAGSVSRVEDICKNLMDQLAAVATPAAPPPAALLESAVSYVGGRRAHSLSVPPQLLCLAARGLAAAKQWQQLGTLLSHAGPGDLTGCGEVLVAVAAAQQYQLLPRLCTCLDEVDASALVDALKHLLAPTTRSNLPARQKRYEALRAVAEATIAEAEQSAAGAAAVGATGTAAAVAAGAVASRQRPRKSRTAAAVVLAQDAATVVDGFSYREVLLHPLLAMPVDGPAVQVALRGLPAPAADALLVYLAKWVGKYADGAVGEALLPLELTRPKYQQVLEWTRLTIDAHLTRLLMSRTPLPALESLQTALKDAVEGGRTLMLLRGALEHVHAGAPLPAAHLAVVTQYTAEYLDLTVR